MKNLASIQEWLMKAVQHPQSVGGVPEMIKGHHGELTPFERLEIYGRSFHGRLLQVLEGEYPALRHAMEPDLFLQFAEEYLRAYPPSSYTLMDLGKNFPDYLRQTRPEDPAELWPDFLIELATLERTFSEVYQGDGVENHGMEPATTSEAISREKWTRKLDCRFPVHEYFLAFKNGAPMELLPEPRATSILIFRRNYRVIIREIQSSAQV